MKNIITNILVFAITTLSSAFILSHAFVFFNNGVGLSNSLLTILSIVMGILVLLLRLSKSDFSKRISLFIFITLVLLITILAIFGFWATFNIFKGFPF